MVPTTQPTTVPTAQPSSAPTQMPTAQPSPAPTRIPTAQPSPAPACTPNKLAYATTRPAGKVASYKTFTYVTFGAALKLRRGLGLFVVGLAPAGHDSSSSAGALSHTHIHAHIAHGRYSATLTNSPKAAAALGGARKLASERELTTTAAQSLGGPFLSTTFTMRLPAGVELKGWASSPKVATIPTVAGGQVTWNLGASIKAGDRIKVVLKLVASTCSTPSDLRLFGKFGYTDTTGAKEVNACLKKPLYVWAPTCAAIPLQQKKKGYSQCTCSICEVGWARAVV